MCVMMSPVGSSMAWGVCRGPWAAYPASQAWPRVPQRLGKGHATLLPAAARRTQDLGSPRSDTWALLSVSRSPPWEQRRPEGRTTRG